ncbi:MAG: hypothetical protein LBG70_03060, partial [Bifidobacteriaceae bacterium]|nr:hypothetical protein [Bifidobacteriaceae bacterium]
LQELLVPMRAIGADSSGQARVGLYHPNGATEVITIEELGCLSGVCAVASDKLVEGDLVRVDRW